MRSSASVVFAGPASPGLTLSPLRRGGGDPCYYDDVDGSIWRTSLMRTGPVTARIRRAAVDTVDCEAWGPGAVEFTDTLPALLGADDDASGFQPTEPTIAADNLCGCRNVERQARRIRVNAIPTVTALASNAECYLIAPGPAVAAIELPANVETGRA